MNNRLILFLFAWGIVGCAVSRWRIAGVGGGEILIGLASLLTILKGDFRQLSTPVSRTWGRFVGLSVAAFFTGTLWAGAIGVWEPVSFVHDTLAFAFCFVSLTLLVPLLTEAHQRSWFLRQFLRAGIVLAVVNLLFYGFFELYLGETTRWIGRFNGVSANPNQLAFYGCLMPFCLLQRPFVLPHWETVLGVGASLGVGWLTGSDALLLSWLFGFVFLIGQSIHRHSWRVDPSLNTHTKAVVGLIVALIVVGILALSRGYATDIYAIGGQGDLRFHRWQNGLVALHSSPLFGLGPGAFSGDEKPFRGQEAHNLYIDWMASGGVLAGLVLVWFQGRVWLNLARTQDIALWSGFVSLLVFSCFHYVARHPIFWLYHLLMLLKSGRICVASSAR